MNQTNLLVIASLFIGFLSTEVCAAPTAEDAVFSDTGLAPHTCRGFEQVVVRSASAADAETVCEGVHRALTFLARAGLSPPTLTTIETVQLLPAGLGDRALGCYIRETGTIQLLTYEKFEAGGEWFGMPRNRELYRALAAHEMAHAVVGCHAGPGRLPVPAHEYVAYVAMFATMSADLRERVLARFPGSGFSSTLQINEINHLVDPNRFGVDAWRHYAQRSRREAWLREVIEGRVVQEWPLDGP